MELTTIIAVAVVFVVLAGLAVVLWAAGALSSKISREEEERNG